MNAGVVSGLRGADLVLGTHWGYSVAMMEVFCCRDQSVLDLDNENFYIFWGGKRVGVLPL